MKRIARRPLAAFAPHGIGGRRWLLSEQPRLDRVKRLANLGQNEPVGCGLVDVRDIPVENGAVFFNQAADIPGKLTALALQLYLLDLGHSVFFRRSGAEHAVAAPGHDRGRA